MSLHRAIVTSVGQLILLLVQGLSTVASTIVICPVMIVLSLVGRRESARCWMRRWCRLVVGVFQIQSTASGLDRLPLSGGCVMVANHSNRFEGPCLLLELGGDFDIAISRRLSLIPLWGQAAVSVGFLVIDRWNTAMAGRRINRAVASVRSGRRILFFPEGRRDRSDAMLPFKKGAFRLAVDAGVPIVPIAVVDGLSKGRDGRLVVAVGEAIPTTGLGRKDVPALVARSRSAIVAMSEEWKRPQPEPSGVYPPPPVRPPKPRSDRRGAPGRVGG